MKASELMTAVTGIVKILEPLTQDEQVRVISAARAALAPIEPLPRKRGRPAKNQGVSIDDVSRLAKEHGES